MPAKTPQGVRNVPMKKKAPKKKINPEARAKALLKRRAPMGAPIFIPKRKRIPMRYVDAITLNGGASAGGNIYHQFRASSIYDPDYTSTGHQPMGHDVYAGLYEHYSVVRSAIRVTLFANGNLNVPLIFRLLGDSDATITSTWQAQCEQANPGEYGILPDTAGLRYSQLVLNQEYDRDAIYKQGSDLHAGTNASFGANPSEGYFFNLVGQVADGSATNWGDTVTALVEIVYLVDVTEPKDQTEN